MMQKKGVSEILSYVILISIAIGLSIGVYAWLKDYANINPKIDCKDGTSIMLSDYNYSADEINLTLKNNGLFNIDGIIVQASNDSKKAPTELLQADILSGFVFPEGHYYFRKYNENAGMLKPSEEKNVKFIAENNIVTIQIQPFIWDEKGYKVVCENAVIKQDI